MKFFIIRHWNYLFVLLFFDVNDERRSGKKNTVIEWDDGGKIGNKNKLILTEVFPTVDERWHLKVLINEIKLKLMLKL